MHDLITPRNLSLYSNLSPEQCARRLAEGIDAALWKPFSFSHYFGSKPFLGGVEGRKFRVFNRIYGRAVPIILFGEFIPRGRGTRVAGLFDIDFGWKVFIRLISLIGILFGGGGIVRSFRNHASLSWPDLGLMSVAVVLLLVGPGFLRVTGLQQQRDIADFLCTKLEAGEDASAFVD